ncbi:ribosomal L7Ae/L30e/S12e/Gadd45 family protein [Paenibacillus cisolokensis]|jgi:Ribosomal protein HS6-type (S12/L30/L7a)|uniref:50S ribosomal protein L7ae n=1 Tax=Paenibacillus cisolokensis TaxID=1658519 RepID=A0ABQ4N2S3_9BACL|nr:MULTISPECIES: ribosomal L7Ae/L30e/S12e/Gadd45 family protein [Paenibacillus]ALS27591.1 ribosomal protein L7ae [Paenibacillus sp. 32O-W]GIQ62456.1 50S ribosomal protein L7ae [Paenibacillus cisolokensis]
MNKGLARLGMAMRAGKLATGDDTVLRAVRQGNARLVIVSADASDNTKKKFRDKCEFYGVPIAEAFSRFELGQAVGKGERVVVAVLDEGFAKLIGSQLTLQSEVEYID